MASSAFTILGTIGMDTKGAENALAAFAKVAQQMAASVDKASQMAERGFKHLDTTVQVMSKDMTGVSAATLAMTKAVGVVSGAVTTLTKSLTQSNIGLQQTNTNLKQTGTGANQAAGHVFGLRDAFAALTAGALAQQLKQFTDRMIDAATQIQGFRRSLTAVTGSAKEAEGILKMVAAYAETTPFENANLTEIATKFASMKQPIAENVALAAKLAFIFKKDLANSGDIVSQANAGVTESMMRMKEQFGFTAQEAQKYGAIVANGSVVMGERGTAANDKYMASITKFVAEREKGLGGNLFGGPKGLGEVISNVSDKSFQLLATLGETLTPTITSISNAIQSLIGWFQNLSPTMQNLIAHGALVASALVTIGVVAGPLIAVIGSMGGGFTRLLQVLVVPIAAMQRLGGATTEVAAASRAAMFGGIGLNAVLGAGALVLGVATIALAAYNAELDTQNKETDKQVKLLVEMHKQTAKPLAKLGALGIGFSNMSLADIEKSGLTGEELTDTKARAEAQAKTLRQQAKEEQDKDFVVQLAEVDRERAKMAGTYVGENKTLVDQAVLDARGNVVGARADTKRAEGYEATASTISTYQTIQKMAEIAGKAVVPDGPRKREYHEIQADIDKTKMLREMNEGPGRAEYGNQMKGYVKESREALVQAQEDKLKTYLRDSGMKGAGQAEAAAKDMLKSGDMNAMSKKYKLTDVQKQYAEDVYTGKMNDPAQVKNLVAVTREYASVKKEILEADVANIKHAEKLAEINRKDTPAMRLKGIHEELAMVKQLGTEKVFSAEEVTKRTRDLSLQAAQERRKEADAQRDLNIELKGLYGDDVAAKEMSLDKKIKGLRQAGATAVQIEKLSLAEKHKIYNQDAQNAIDAAQRVLAAKADLATKTRSNQTAKVEERIKRGDVGATDELIAIQKEQMAADIKRAEEEDKAKRAKLEKELSPGNSLTKYDRAAKTEELNVLKSGAPLKAERERITQEGGSKIRQEVIDKLKTTTENRSVEMETEKTRLGMRQDMLTAPIKAGAYVSDMEQRKILENLRLQLDLTKQMATEKAAVLMAEKSGDPAAQAQIQKKLKLEIMQAERETLDTAKGITAEIEKQNALQQGTAQNKGVQFSGVEFSGLGDFGSGFGDFSKKNKKTMTDSQVGRTVNVDVFGNNQVIKDATAGKKTKPETTEGTPLADKRNAEINEKGAAADAKGRVKVVSGQAKLVIKVETKDSAGNTVSSDQEAIIPLNNQVPQNTRQPLGGEGGKH